MEKLQIKILDKDGKLLAASGEGESAHLLYEAEYRPGDRIVLEADAPHGFCQIRLEDSMLPATVFMKEASAEYPIPFGELRDGLSPKAFTGNRHLLSAKLADPRSLFRRKNLALNPYDFHEGKLFPHASANVETRGEAVFAARNAIDGCTASEGHGAYPYQSWGINQDVDACLHIDFGMPVTIDEVVLVLRADFPHDNFWKQATLVFSDGSEETLHLEKTGQPQAAAFYARTVEWAELKNLIPSEESDSPFPALTEIELWGTLADK